MTASSTKIGYSYKSKYGRLTETRGRGWCAKRCCESQDWLKVDLGKTFQICGVATQGVSEWNNWPVWWLTDFRLSYSTNGGNWTMCKDRNGLNMVSNCLPLYFGATNIQYNTIVLPLLDYCSPVWDHSRPQSSTFFFLNCVSCSSGNGKKIEFFDWPFKNECATRYNNLPFYA